MILIITSWSFIVSYKEFPSVCILKSYNDGNHPSACTQVSYYNVRRRSEDIREALYYSRPRFSVTATNGWFVDNQQVHVHVHNHM